MSKSVMTSLQKRLISIFGKRFLFRVRKFAFWPWKLWAILIANRINLSKNKSKNRRFLEIGSGNNKIKDFESLDINPGRNVDYVADASKKLPFRDETFDLIYASHVLEHIVWYKTQDVLKEWVRILKSGGQLEVWVPDGYKICRTLVDAELEDKDNTHLDGWYKFNPEKDYCIWTSGRIFSYGDGSGNPCDPNWHSALFTARYLKNLLEKSDLKDVCQISHDEVRGYDHGWINLGVRGTK